MFIISRKPPEHDCEYVRIELDTEWDSMYVEQCRFHDGVHEKFQDEVECDSCGHYWGDEYYELPRWALDRKETSSLKFFYLIPTKRRVNTNGS